MGVPSRMQITFLECHYADAAWSSRGDDHTGEAGLTPSRVQVCSGVGKELAAMLAGDEASVSKFVKAMDPARFRMFPYEPAAML